METIAELYASAAYYWESADFDKAEKAIHVLLAKEPSHAGANYLLGMIAFRRGQLPHAVEHFLKAVSGDPGIAHYRSALAAAYQGLEKFAEAAEHHQQALKLDPDDSMILCNWGITLVSLGRAAEAVEVFRKALQLEPEAADVLTDLAGALNTLERYDEAIQCCQKAIRIQPNSPQAYNNMGNASFAQGKLREAAGYYEHALYLWPQFTRAHVNLANALVAGRRYAEAIHYLHRVLDFEPRNAEVHGRIAGACFLDNALDEAEAWSLRALELDPQQQMAAITLGLIDQAQGRIAEARSRLGKAVAAEPNDLAHWCNYLGTLLYDPKVESPELLVEHRRWSKEMGLTASDARSHPNSPDEHRVLRVGYVSPDFRAHAVAYFLEPILLHHNSNSVETFCYAELPVPDARTMSFRAMAKNWRETYAMSDDSLAALIREDAIDILVDLAGMTSGTRLLVFAKKPAPVQISYLGYPCTTGLGTMDYRLVDAVTAPPGEETSDVEELHRLPVPFACYWPSQSAPSVSSLPAEATGVITFGSLHKLEKLNAAVLDLWAQLLRQAPSSRLLFVRNTLQGRVVQCFAEQLQKRGIPQARLAFRCVKPADIQHLQAYEEIDIALDAFPWNGHTTACEALWMGVPVVALRGRRHSARMTASVLTAVGLEDLIAEDEAGYCRIAARLAADIVGLARLRRELRGRMMASPLCDGAAFTRHLEAAYRAMWQRWCAQQKDDS